MSWSYLLALGITLLIEVPLVAAVFEGQRLRMAVVAALATTATHLLMHFALPPLVGSYAAMVLVGELAATGIEAGVYVAASRPRRVGHALVASGLANAASYGAGLLLLG